MDRKPISWNSGKNTKLKLERGVSFEIVRERIFNNAFRLIKNPSKNYVGQWLFLVSINGRQYVVPFTEYETHIFLRTIYEV